MRLNHAEVGSNTYEGITPVFTSSSLDIGDGEVPPAPRTYFPETWLWDLVPVG